LIQRVDLVQFISDNISQFHYLQLWKFNDDADRRNHWKTLFADKDFMEGFAAKFRPLVMTQEVKLLLPAPWGPHP
jgi:NIPSNAP